MIHFGALVCSTFTPPEAICRTLDKHVRLLRLARNLSQRELAGVSGVSPSTVRQLETALTYLQSARHDLS